MREAYAVEVLHFAVAACKEVEVTIGLEPLGPAEGDFMLTAESGIRLAKMVGSPHCKLHLDVKAMSERSRSRFPTSSATAANGSFTSTRTIRTCSAPGWATSTTSPFSPLFKEINYDGWVSVEAFKYEPSPDEIARQSIEYMRKVEAEI